MIELIKKCLNANKKVSAWKINEYDVKSCELFYVIDKLEVNRASDVTNIEVTIYVDKDSMRGSTSFSVYPYFTEEIINEKINDAIVSAEYALNPYFDIPNKVEETIPEVKSNLMDRPFNEIANDLVKAVFKANIYDDGYLNATEFFLYKTNERIINSKGIDQSIVRYSGQIELIPSWEKDDKEVEIYHMVKFSELDLDKITEEVKENLLLAKARFNAIDLKLNKDIKIIIQDDEVSEIFKFFSDDLSYGKKYQQMSRSEIGKSVQGEQISGTKLNLKLVPYYKGCSRSSYIDDDGVILHEVSLIEDGVAKAMHGSYQFGYYLGIKNPTGMLPITVVMPGSKSFKEMAKEPYVRCVRFSGIQIDDSTGAFGGEIRLGFYFDGEKEIPVTGFTISGNLFDVRGSMEYSKDEVSTSNYHGPKYLEIKGMKIA